MTRTRTLATTIAAAFAITASAQSAQSPIWTSTATNVGCAQFTLPRTHTPTLACGDPDWPKNTIAVLITRTHISLYRVVSPGNTAKRPFFTASRVISKLHS